MTNAELNKIQYQKYKEKYCVNCQSYTDCDLIPINKKGKVIEDFVYNFEECRDWLPVEVE